MALSLNCFACHPSFRRYLLFRFSSVLWLPREGNHLINVISYIFGNCPNSFWPPPLYLYFFRARAMYPIYFCKIHWNVPSWLYVVYLYAFAMTISLVAGIKLPQIPQLDIPWTLYGGRVRAWVDASELNEWTYSHVRPYFGKSFLFLHFSRAWFW